MDDAHKVVEEDGDLVLGETILIEIGDCCEEPFGDRMSLESIGFLSCVLIDQMPRLFSLFLRL